MPGVWDLRGLEALLRGRGVSQRSCVPAAILGMHTLMSNQQYYQALGSSSIVNKEGLNSEYTALIPSSAPLPLPEQGRPGSEGVRSFLLPLPTHALRLIADIFKILT